VQGARPPLRGFDAALPIRRVGRTRRSADSSLLKIALKRVRIDAQRKIFVEGQAQRSRQKITRI
jgi:hypothetical protein